MEMTKTPEQMRRLPDPLPVDPMPTLAAWFAFARDQEITPNPNAMVLATIDSRQGAPEPDARVVLCKSLDAAAGRLVFYTNYHSVKGRQLESTPRASAVFHWDSLELQARVRGPVMRCPGSESDEYFNSRPLLSRLGAWASKQSQPVASRAALEQQLTEIKARFGVDDPRDPAEDKPIPRPEHWGGFELWAEVVELWIGQRGRLHERGRWRRAIDTGAAAPVTGEWEARRLQP